MNPLEQKMAIDPLRRVFVPIERRNTNGTTSFKTQDGTAYRRGTDGAIRVVGVKVNGKDARKARAKARKT